MSTSELLPKIEQHLDSNAQLLQELSRLNTDLKSLMTKAGIRGPAEGEMHAVDHTTQKIERLASEIRMNHDILINEICASTEKEFRTVGDYLASLPQEIAGPLRLRQTQQFEKACQTQAVLQGNQAGLFYSMDFYHRYLGALCEQETDDQRYSVDGLTRERSEGHLIRRTC